MFYDVLGHFSTSLWHEPPPAVGTLLHGEVPTSTDTTVLGHNDKGRGETASRSTIQ